MALRFVAYRKQRQWVLKYRDPWSGKPRTRSFATEAEARTFESVQAELHAREKDTSSTCKAAPCAAHDSLLMLPAPGAILFFI